MSKKLHTRKAEPENRVRTKPKLYLKSRTCQKFCAESMTLFSGDRIFFGPVFGRNQSSLGFFGPVI